jgi:Ala-tRNA(Pro) deacylase
MSGIAARVQTFLKQEQVTYETLHHPTDYTAKETAEDTHTPPKEFAKTVFLCVDGRPAMAVLPATEFVSLRKVQQALGAEEVRLASEEESRQACPDSDVGAAPPFGNLYELPVYVSPLLAEDEKITFNAGSHQDAIRMSYRDFEKLVQPHVMALSKHD